MSKYHDPIQSMGAIDLSGLFKRDPLMGGIFSKKPNLDANGNILPDTATGKRMLAALAMDRIKGQQGADADIKRDAPRIASGEKIAGMKNTTDIYGIDANKGIAADSNKTQKDIAGERNAVSLIIQQLLGGQALDQIGARGNEDRATGKQGFDFTTQTTENEYRRRADLANKAANGDQGSRLLMAPNVSALEELPFKQKLAEAQAWNMSQHNIGDGGTYSKDGSLYGPAGVSEEQRMMQMGNTQIPVTSRVSHGPVKLAGRINLAEHGVGVPAAASPSPAPYDTTLSLTPSPAPQAPMPLLSTPKGFNAPTPEPYQNPFNPITEILRRLRMTPDRVSPF